ncbi:uncharacterized protein HMPREF1541_03664 [Cyphellophora europaea CBS 101466]|uniref:6-methylsalicylate decarboxylase n=1 Tax=Cyphellophora europaea (strain CBS 101466) TaxID=1220924 RepID=W2S0Z5_CYPE1|nr:uncharacterized protein HMPREF1541_03664 [Cyphellophora europaea CBS 101466]ETN41728.1 hypothetical protein HMPREF1541_03664 [Cyphellophora europaea CBS 101466]
MGRVDVHHHFYPDVYTKAIQQANGDPSGWTIPPWTLTADRELCASLNISKAILSATAPGPDIERDPHRAATLARQINEAGAAIAASDPTHYAFFASVPTLLAPDLALAEIAYALDTLHARGVILMTRYGSDAHYLGHADFIPIWTELDRRHAVVFIHPTHPVDTTHVNPHLPGPMFDYPHETGRTAMDLLTSGRMPSIRNCKVILSHAGGTLPYIFMRAAGMLPYTPFTTGSSTAELLKEARRFYFDTAISCNEFTLGLLMRFAEEGHVLFGTDFPNAPREGIEFFEGEWGKFVGGDEALRRGVEWENAVGVFGEGVVEGGKGGEL